MAPADDRPSRSRGPASRPGRGRPKGRPGAASGRRPSDGRSGSSGGRRSGGAPRKYSKERPPAGRRDRDEQEPIPGNQQWGGLARKGVLRANHDEVRDYEKAQERRRTDDELEPDELAKREARAARREERERRQRELRAEAEAAVSRSGANTPKKAKRAPRPKPALDRAVLPTSPAHGGDEYSMLVKLFGAPQAKKYMRKLAAAAEAFEAERYADVRRTLKPLLEVAPQVAELRELNGLTLYRQGNYRAAAKELEEFRVLAASAEQNPVLMDCYRAQGRWADVAELWTELAEVSPSAPVVNEGRIVMANAMAEQGDLDGAVSLLSKGWKRPSKPRDHHLRRAYALADLYERSGDLPRARALFEWLRTKAPGFVDVAARIRSLR